LHNQDKVAGHPLRRRARLGSLQGVRREMARLYQLALDGELPADQASRMVYMLREIRCAIESETLERIEQRLAEVTATREVIRDGRSKQTAPPQPSY
jgi:hypothetical protein